MSTPAADRHGLGTDRDARLGPETFRLLALGGVLVLTASYVGVLRDVTAVVGGTGRLLVIVLLMLAAATVVAHAISPRAATVAAAAAAVLGFAYYLTAAGLGVGAVASATGQLLSDTVTLVTGMPVDRMVAAGVWTLAFVPGPVFLSWYLAMRSRYALAVLPGGGALVFLVLTGDASPVATLVGTLGAIAAVSFGELERRGGTIAQVDVLAILFAITIALSLSVSVVPGGSPSPVTILESDGHDGTLEGSINQAPDETAIAGDVDLTPEVRFTVRSEEPSYWRTGVYDRFTGDGWIRTGQEEPYDGALPEPPGEAETVRQTVFVEDDALTMPTAPQPVDVQGTVEENTMVTVHGQFRPDETLRPGDAYNVESAVVDDSPEALRGAGTDYPEGVTDYYLQTPEGTSSEFEERTAEIVADAEDPYEKAAAIEEHLRTSKDYSLNVTRPDGNVAESFLLEMDEGYCVYFASTMTQMLRTEGVPARYVTGYSTGQQVDENEWVVRGLDAHAWVEVYFPDRGWVAFEPTPSRDRERTHDERLLEARENGEPGVDTDRSENVPLTETPAESELPRLDVPDLRGAAANWTDGETQGTDDREGAEQVPEDVRSGERPYSIGPDGTIDLDDVDLGVDDESDENDSESAASEDDEAATGWSAVERVFLGVALLVGVVAGAHRTGVATRVRRDARLHWHGFRTTPDRDAERAYRRLEWLLERRYRDRRPNESPRQYLDSLSERGSIDERARRVLETYERAVYGDGVDRDEAEAAIERVDALARRRLPLVGRRRE